MMNGGERLSGFDAAILVETIEHLEPDRLSVLERAVFRAMRPGVLGRKPAVEAGRSEPKCPVELGPRCFNFRRFEVSHARDNRAAVLRDPGLAFPPARFASRLA